MKLRRVALVLTISIVMIAASFTTAFGCTSLFVGKDVSANGSRYISRTEDMSDNYCKIFGIREAADHPEGEMFIADNGFQMPYPAHTLKYSYIRDSEGYGETVYDDNGNRIGEAYAAAGQNELGVSMTATVTTSQSSNTRRYDPMKRNGIAELSIPSVVLSVATSARHACEYLGSVIDQYGNAEPNSILISDANESWDFETLSGTQWVALKLDDKRAAMNPNLSLMQGIDITDTENVICSKDLVELPKKDGWLVTDENGFIEVAKTYGSGYQSYNTRIYQGLFFLNRELAEVMDSTTVNADNPNPFYVDPTFKLTLLDIIHFEGYRGKGSLEDQDGEHRSRSVRSIGTNGQTECHIFETRDNMPVELATIQWECNQDAEFGIFLPHFTALMTEVDKSYEEAATSYSRVPHGTSYTWNIAQINNLCNRNRALGVGDAVREYFDVYQQSLIDQQAAVDEAMLAYFAESKEKAIEVANALSKDITKQTLEMTTLVIDELDAYIAGDHAEPFALSDKVKSIMPFYAVPEEGIADAQAAAVESLDGFLPDRANYLPEQWDEIGAILADQAEIICASNTQARIDQVLANAAETVPALIAEVKTSDEVIAEKEEATAAAEQDAQAAATAAAAADRAATQAQTAADRAAASAATAAQTAQAAAEAAAQAAEAAAANPEDADLAAAAAQAAEAAAQAQANAEAAQAAADAAQANADAAKNQAAIANAASDAKTAEAAAAKADQIATTAQADAVKANEKAAAAAAAAEEAVSEAAAAQAALDKVKAEDAATIAALKKEITKLQTTVAKNSTVSGLKLTQKSRKVTVKYSKTAGANAYQIQYKLSTAKKWTNLKKSFTKAKATSKKLKKGKKYSFRVRTITKVDGKNVYGKWATKSIKIKK